MATFKLTGVGRLLHQDHPQAPIQLPITLEQYDDPTFIPRLSFRHGPRVRMGVEDHIRYLAEHTDHALFVDTNLTWLPAEWWEELFSRSDRVYVTGRVLHELVPYLSRNPEHPLREAIADRHPAIELVADLSDRVASKCLEYYAELLARRRGMLAASIAAFTQTNGRPPDGRELVALKMNLQRSFGERTLRLNLKPVSPFRTDEALVFLAVHHALTTGQPTKILSGDSDVEEQFYTLARLLTAHYYAGLIADEYVADFARFQPRAARLEAAPGLDKFVASHSATAIDLGDRGLHQFLKPLTTFVPVTTWTLGDTYMSELTYGYETTMSRVFETKAETSGLSTAKLTGRNLHPWGLPAGLHSPGANEALIAFDECFELPRAGMRAAHLDAALATWPGDPHVRVAPPSDPASQRLLELVPASGRRGVVPLRARTPAIRSLWLPDRAAA